jgi:hypothetical protein
LLFVCRSHLAANLLYIPVERETLFRVSLIMVVMYHINIRQYHVS